MFEDWRNPVGSLFSLAVDYVVNNIHVYINFNRDTLNRLPNHIKDRILRKFTASSYFWKNVEFKEVLDLLTHKGTFHLDLTSVLLNDEILLVLHKCANLKKLYLTRVGSHYISTKGLIDLFPNTKSLTLLCLSHCNAVNDEVLESLSKHCTNLAAIDIGGCKNVTDAGLQHLSTIGKIEWLTLSHTQVSNLGVIEFVKGKNGKNIKELRINNCQNISDCSLVAIAENCPNLEVLIFYSCSTTRDDTASILEDHNLKKLKQLTWTVSW